MNKENFNKEAMDRSIAEEKLEDVVGGSIVPELRIDGYYVQCDRCNAWFKGTSVKSCLNMLNIHQQNGCKIG